MVHYVHGTHWSLGCVLTSRNLHPWLNDNNLLNEVLKEALYSLCFTRCNWTMKSKGVHHNSNVKLSLDVPPSCSESSVTGMGWFSIYWAAFSRGENRNIDRIADKFPVSNMGKLYEVALWILVYLASSFSVWWFLDLVVSPVRKFSRYPMPPPSQPQG